MRNTGCLTFIKALKPYPSSFSTTPNYKANYFNNIQRIPHQGIRFFVLLCVHFWFANKLKTTALIIDIQHLTRLFFNKGVFLEVTESNDTIMKKKLFLSSLFLLSFFFQSCVKEEVRIVEPPRMTAEMHYSFYSGIRTVEIEGEIINRGNVYLEGAQLRFRLYDRNGFLITTYFQDFSVRNSPNYGSYFYTSLNERYVYEVKADIWNLW